MFLDDIVGPMSVEEAKAASTFKGPHGTVDIERTPGRTVVRRQDWDDSNKSATEVPGGKYYSNNSIKPGQGSSHGPSNTSSLDSMPSGERRTMPRLDHDANDAPSYEVDETIVGGGTGTPVPNDAQLKKMIWDALKIDAPTGVEALQLAIVDLTKRPQTRMVQNMLGRISMIADRMNIGPEYRNILKKFTEAAVAEDSWHGQTDAWHDGQNAWSGEQHEMVEYVIQGPSPDDSESPIHGDMEEDIGDSPVAGAIVRRIMMQHPELLKQYGPESVGAAVDNVADYVGDVDEIGSSDVSAWVAQVERMLKENPPEAFAEGSQDFNKVEPYAVCLAGKPVKKFDYYEQARKFHDNWKQKLYREGDKAKADTITLMPLNLDETGKGTPVPAKEFARGVLKDLKKVNVKEAEGRVDPILIKALKRMPDGLATHGQVLDAAYDAYAMEKGYLAMRGDYGVTDVYIPKLMGLYKDKHGLTFNEDTGSWIAYDPATKQIKKRFKTHTAGKSYAKTHGLSFASSEYYFDIVKVKAIAEFAPSPERDDSDKVPNQILTLANRWWNAGDKQPQITNVLRSLGWSIAQVESEDDAVQMQHDDGTTYFISADEFNPDVFEASTDYSKRRQRERDVDAGKPVARQPKNPQTDYAKKRAQDKKDLALGESYWTRLQNERNTKAAGLVAELQESIKDIK